MKNLWNKWQGGDCPVAEYRSPQVIYRSGGTTVEQANRLRWTHTGQWDDIVAYRINETPNPEKDKVVQAVCEDLLQRSAVGIAKYGTTLERSDLNMRQWLQHAYEETLDQANYLKRCIIEIDGAEHWMGGMVRTWVEGMQPGDGLKAYSVGDLQDELQRRKTAVVVDSDDCDGSQSCPHGHLDWDDCPDCCH